MALTESTVVGSDVAVVQEKASGLRTQTAATSRNTATYNLHGDHAAGVVQCWIARCETAADVAYDAAGAIVNVFGVTKGVRNEKYRILKIETVLRVLRTGGTPDTDIKVEKGNGAASESFASLVATVDIDSDTVDLPTNRILVAAECLLLSGETLRCQQSVAGSTTTGTGEVEFHIYVIPVLA